MILRRFLATAALILVAAAAQGDEVPYFATDDVPDYEASMVVRNAYGEPRTHPRSVFHHDGYTRVEEPEGSSLKISYGYFFGQAVLRAFKNADGAFTSSFATKIVPSRDYHRIREVTETSDFEEQGGERCRWLELMRAEPVEGASSPKWLRCLSDDGIEIASKELFGDGKPMHERSLLWLARRPVAAAEVSPPAQLFSARYWLRPLRDYPAKPADAADFEVRMVGRESEVRLLRHYPWWHEERRGKDGSIRFKVWNELEEQGLFVSIAEGTRRFEASRAALDPKRPWNRFDRRTGKVDMKRSETHLGEDCDWFDVMPKTADAGRAQCLTHDGIPMRDVISSGWGKGESYAAVSYHRRAVDIEEMMPPPKLLDAAEWGFSTVD